MIEFYARITDDSLDNKRDEFDSVKEYYEARSPHNFNARAINLKSFFGKLKDNLVENDFMLENDSLGVINQTFLWDGNQLDVKIHEYSDHDYRVGITFDVDTSCDCDYTDSEKKEIVDSVHDEGEEIKNNGWD